MKLINTRSIVFLASFLLLQAHASGPQITPDDAGDYLARARTQVEDDIRVTAKTPGGLPRSVTYMIHVHGTRTSYTYIIHVHDTRTWYTYIIHVHHART